MSARRAAVAIPAQEKLIDAEERNAALSWPLAVDQWLEERLAQARDAGMATSRKELAAALLTANDPTDEELVQWLRDYRRKTAGQLLGLRDPDGVLNYLPRRPGPRSSRARG